MLRFFGFSVIGPVSAAVVLVLTGTAPSSAAEVVELTQTGCQFVEPERKDHGYKTTKKTDCEKINGDTEEGRLAGAEVVELKAGDYVFRVTNKNVPYPLGFWIREKDYNWANPIHKATKISVSGGGLTAGKSRDYSVKLKPGEYLFSCPLNTTPNYRLVVTE